MKATINTLYFIIGTEAELMKLFKVINEIKSRGIACKIIATGQNDLRESPFLKLINDTIFLDLCRSKGEKKAGSYLKWLIDTAQYGKKTLREFFNDKDRAHNLIAVHGDTLTTAIGAWLARKCKIPYVHIESGLRSFNLLSPFPEELDRFYSSKGAIINFCPADQYMDYAQKTFKGKAVSTVYNTGIETLFWAIGESGDTKHSLQPAQKYFMFMLHRQENLHSKQFLQNTVKKIAELSTKMHCVFIYHEQTKAAMENAGVYDMLCKSENVTILPRQGYEDFIRLINHSEFVVTDGCGNQQEFYYLGKPYLIMRTAVEKSSEGLGWNAKVFGGDFNSILQFYEQYHQYKKDRVSPTIEPSCIVADEIDKYFLLGRI